MVEAAFGIHDLINETMAAAAKHTSPKKAATPKSSPYRPLAVPDRFTPTAWPKKSMHPAYWFPHWPVLVRPWAFLRRRWHSI